MIDSTYAWWCDACKAGRCAACDLLRGCEHAGDRDPVDRHRVVLCAALLEEDRP